MSKMLTLKELYYCTYATNERIAQKHAGMEPDEKPDEFIAVYHRDRGGVEHPVLVQEVKEIIEESKWSPLLEQNFERVAFLLEEDTSSSIPVGENKSGEIYELADGEDGPIVGDKVQIQEQ